ncbi:MAG TPA: hypothetical protein VM681_00505 [Candidatus Thermoplasmatota archaeon]|nr:hypothetical protein [Candidatus Thermoplasmatota archaeon]
MATPSVSSRQATFGVLAGAAAGTVGALFLATATRDPNGVHVILALAVGGGLAGAIARGGLEAGFRNGFTAGLLSFGLLTVFVSSFDAAGLGLRRLVFPSTGIDPSFLLVFGLSLMMASFAGAVTGTFLRSPAKPSQPETQPAYAPWSPPPGAPQAPPVAGAPYAQMPAPSPPPPWAQAPLPHASAAPPLPAAARPRLPEPAYLERALDCPGCGRRFLARYASLPAPVVCPSCGKRGTLQA